MHWFTHAYWAYLFERPWTLRKVWCRYREHPYFYRWHAYGEATQPDYRCRNCGDNLD